MSWGNYFLVRESIFCGWFVYPQKQIFAFGCLKNNSIQCKNPDQSERKTKSYFHVKFALKSKHFEMPSVNPSNFYLNQIKYLSNN